MDAFLLSAVRTPVGKFLGGLSALTAPQLGSLAIAETLKRAGVSASQVSEVIMGHVVQAGCGQNPARQAALGAGIPTTINAHTTNMVCGSGLKAVMLAADNILLGNTQMAVAGGQENMTLAPHLLENSRGGYRMGHISATDSMIKDGLWDPYSNFHMGNAAELCVKEYKVTRQAQDEFAVDSYKKAQKAMADGMFKNEIAAVEVAAKGGSQSFATDEEPGKARFDKMTELRPAFDKEGTITAANASKINDGAAALVLASEQAVKSKGLKPIARVVAHGTFAQDPKWFTTAPVNAIKRACEKAKLKVDDIDLFEINEAFSVVTMVAMKELNIAPQKVNVHGGAVAIGHPIGASGARILTTLIHSLYQHGKRYGLATLCVGGGEGVALIVERI